MCVSLPPSFPPASPLSQNLGCRGRPWLGIGGRTAAGDLAKGAGLGLQCSDPGGLKLMTHHPTGRKL